MKSNCEQKIENILPYRPKTSQETVLREIGREIYGTDEDERDLFVNRTYTPTCD